VAVRRRVGVLAARTAALTGERGSAIIEFVFIAVVALVPLVYLLAAVSVVQRSQLAASQAAREAGRAFATSDSAAEAAARVDAAVRLAFAAHGLPDEAVVRFVAADDPCGSSPIEPVLAPGTSFTVCVLDRAEMPGVPRFVAGRGIESIGRFTVHVDDFRTVEP
jgi:hypothetical protein